MEMKNAQMILKKKKCKSMEVEKQTKILVNKKSSDKDLVNILTPLKATLDENISLIKASKERLPSTPESDRKNISKFYKRLPNQTSVCSELENQPYASSSESIDPVKIRGSPSDLLQKPPQRNMRIVNPTENTKFGDERILMATSSKHIPFMVCSFIPYTKKRIDQKKDEKRKRATSSTRPVSSIGDGLDPFDSLGIERASEGQEVSFGYLLTPTQREEQSKQNITIDVSTDQSNTKKKK